jgi:hypothetical protein
MLKQPVKSEVSEVPWTITGLGAQGPLPELKEKLALFGQFVGDWDIVESRYIRPDGTWSTAESGELHWGWILSGRATQDVWMSIDEKTHNAIPEEITVRFYDSKIDAWQVVRVSPREEVAQIFIGQQVGDEIVIEGRSAEGYLVRWIFSEITQKSFRWRGEKSHDDGKTWTLRQEMRMRRQHE